MLKYTFKKILVSLLTILVLITIVFVLVRALPGDPFAGEKVPEEIRIKQAEYYGLNKPLHLQYFTFLKNLSKGDLGYSLKFRNRTVNQIIASAFPYSADLGIRAIIYSSISGIL